MLCTGASPQRYSSVRIHRPNLLESQGTHLVVETSFAFQKVEERLILFRSPKVHVRYLEITPNCGLG